MALVSELLTPDQRLGLEQLLAGIDCDPGIQRECIAELLITRDLLPAIRSSRYLMNNPSVRAIVDRLPGSRTVPRANLPAYKARRR